MKDSDGIKIIGAPEESKLRSSQLMDLTAKGTEEIIGASEEPKSASSQIIDMAGEELQEIVQEQFEESPRGKFQRALQEWRDKINRMVALERQLPRTDTDSDVTRQFQRLGTELFGAADDTGKPKPIRKLRYELEKTCKRLRNNERSHRKKLMRTVADPTLTKPKRLAAAKRLGLLGQKKWKAGDVIKVGDQFYRIGKHGEHRRVNRDDIEAEVLKDLERNIALQAIASGK